MKTAWLILSLFFCSVAGYGASPEKERTQDPRERLAEPFSNRKELAAAIKAAESAGVAPESILDAQVLFYLNRNDVTVEELDALLAELKALAPKWRGGKCRLLQTPQTLKAVQHALRARRAQEQDDETAFETNVKEALWLEPDLAVVMGDWIREFHKVDGWSYMKVPLNETLLDLDGNTVTLEELLKGRKGLVLDFWATWCGPCLRSMPELSKKTEQLTEQGIVVASVNTENAAKAIAFSAKHDYAFQWLVEPKGRSLSRHFKIDSIPRLILIDPKGNILFNEHPNSELLPKALNKIGVTLKP